ncbi:uncharacterized protein MELLADRAFT_85270 [Melampsora larici-populina 98AG31]|uniref:CCZ1/INTU/HSP4 first Longin domain-containing protein n=1 Tax=Melampsora larici-populina (strain 98AG31 / pathotype 3-4-7) TaxID=747676 RepID=F4RI58_MELLP|nr:uncharacterized protein MELLADRAFT_85270 [Melampsora larici-populina 98AG31]EGG07944.1 hypothetical protein MELLADRAFT_85270 [Melampsora larici-populina 98AG31]
MSSQPRKFPFPTLVSFTIWSNKVQPPKNEEAVPDQEETNEPEDRNRPEASLPSSVLFFSDRTSNLSPEKRNRQIGLLQGLVNFSSVLGFNANSSRPSSHTGSSATSQHKPTRDSSLRVVHSSKHKILYHEPEPGFHICAMISLPQSIETFANGPNKMSTSLTINLEGKPSSYHTPTDDTLLNSLKSGYLEYRLLHGIMSKYTNSRKELIDMLERFWSVWLWRWDVQKSGCGGVDFDQYLGYSNSLARYLLSLLGGSEAKSTTQHPPPPSNVFSNFAMRSMDGIQDVSMKGLAEPSQWVQKAFSWASASFASSHLSGIDDSAQTIEGLDEQLRAEMGISFIPPAKSKTTNTSSVIPTPSVAARLSSGRPCASQSYLFAKGEQPSKDKSISDRTSTLHYPENLFNYPENLFNLYPIVVTEADHDYYPKHLLNLYPAPTLDLDRHPCESTPAVASSPTNLVPAQNPASQPATEPTKRAASSIHDPRSAHYNVELALADAMAEKSSATDNLSPIEKFVRRKMLSSSPLSEGMDQHTVPKQLSIFVRNGELKADVLWFQRDDWNLALIFPSADGTKPGLTLPNAKLLSESSRLLKRLCAQWPDQSSNDLVKTKSLDHRFLIQLKTNDVYYKQSSIQSAWLSKNEIWSGKQSSEKEVEICLGVLECLKDQPTETSPVKETFLRTQSGQWIATKRGAKASISMYTEIDTVLILPSGSGTLIEVDNEMRKLERVCEQVDFTSWK